MALLKCPECGNSVSERAAACPKCGLPIQEILKAQAQFCQKCGAPLTPGASFCTDCDAPVSPAAEPKQPQPANIEDSSQFYEPYNEDYISYEEKQALMESEQRQKKNRLLMGVAILFALAVIGLCIWLFVATSGDDDKAGQEITSISSTDFAATPEIEATDTIASEIPTSSLNEYDLGDVKPLTQYMLVKVTDGGVSFRDNIAQQLKNLGFSVKTSKRPAYVDEMDSFTCLTASRRGNGGTTKITMTDGEDTMLTIDFANKAELDEFVNSMNISNYMKEGSLYSHPDNDGLKIYVRVNGLRVKIICPFEMLPSNF